MESIYAIPYYVLECPNLKLKRPSWAHTPSAMFVFAVVLASYFLVTGGTQIHRVQVYGRLGATDVSAKTVWVTWVDFGDK